MHYTAVLIPHRHLQKVFFFYKIAENSTTTEGGKINSCNRGAEIHKMEGNVYLIQNVQIKYPIFLKNKKKSQDLVK